MLKAMIPTSMVMLIPTTHCSVHLSRIPGKKVKDTLYLLIVATLCLAVEWKVEWVNERDTVDVGAVDAGAGGGGKRWLGNWTIRWWR